MPGIKDSIEKHSPEGVLSSIRLAPLTTMRVGGRSRWFSEIRDSASLAKAYQWAKGQGLPIFFLGDGSNVLFSDLEFPGLVLRNRTSGKERSGNQILVAGGENLGDLIRWTNQQQLSGIERMYGIPGTVAGALVGNAGAYGQEICESVTEATVWSPDGVIRELSRSQLEFDYRHSVFKERKDCFILDCTLSLRPTREKLQEDFRCDPGDSTRKVPARAKMSRKLLQECAGQGPFGSDPSRSSGQLRPVRQDPSRKIARGRGCEGRTLGARTIRQTSCQSTGQ